MWGAQLRADSRQGFCLSSLGLLKRLSRYFQLVNKRITTPMVQRTNFPVNGHGWIILNGQVDDLEPDYLFSLKYRHGWRL